MEELKIKALSAIVDMLQSGVDNVPPYVWDLLHRYIVEECITNGIIALAFIIIYIVVRLILSYLKKEYKKDYDKWDIREYQYRDNIAWMKLLNYIVLTICVIIVIVCISQSVSVIITPEIEMISDIMPSRSC